MAEHFRADDTGLTDPTSGPAYDDLLFAVQRLDAENDRLREERDRAVTAVATLGCYLSLPTRARPMAIKWALRWIEDEIDVAADVVAALAEHDRRSTEGER